MTRWLPATLAFLILVSFATKAAAVTVSVAPAETTVTQGDDFTVRIVTGDFPDLKAFHLVHLFDPTRIICLGASPGDVLTRFGSACSFQAFATPDNTIPTGAIAYDAAMLSPCTSYGPGILAFYHFHAVAAGNSPIQCFAVDFRDSFNNQTTPACVSGLVHVVGPVPGHVGTWGKVKALYR